METPKKVKITEFKNLNELELKEQVVYYYDRVTVKSKSSLFQARRCGAALLEMKKRQGYGKFQKWIRDNLKGEGKSYPNLSKYMIVAKSWKNPQMQEAIKNGTVTGVDSYLTFFRGLSPNPESKSSPKENLTPQQRDEYNEAIKYLCHVFKNHLLEMDSQQIDDLGKKFDDTIWPQWQKILDDATALQKTENPPAIKIAS